MYYKLEISETKPKEKIPFFYNVFTFDNSKDAYKYLSALAGSERPYFKNTLTIELGSVTVEVGLNYTNLEKITIENCFDMCNRLYL